MSYIHHPIKMIVLGCYIMFHKSIKNDVNNDNKMYIIIKIYKCIDK